MNMKLEELQTRIGAEHQDLLKFVQHTFDELDRRSEEHRKLTSVNALAGIKPEGTAEADFYRHVNEMKNLLIEMLEKTTQDLEHLGDKNWDKNFVDGVED